MNFSLSPQNFVPVELKMTFDDFRNSLTATDPPAE
jgi:hypothetical protein